MEGRVVKGARTNHTEEGRSIQAPLGKMENSGSPCLMRNEKICILRS